MLPLRLVMDTNIVVSALLTPKSLQRAAVVLALAKPARWYVSQPILNEYREVVSRPELHIRKGAQRQMMQWISNRCICISPSRRIEAASDPDDNIFLECADKGQADYLITGNLRHFPRYWKKTKIITAREFLNVIAPHLLS